MKNQQLQYDSDVTYCSDFENDTKSGFSSEQDKFLGQLADQVNDHFHGRCLMGNDEIVSHITNLRGMVYPNIKSYATAKNILLALNRMRNLNNEFERHLSQRELSLSLETEPEPDVSLYGSFQQSDCKQQANNQNNNSDSSFQKLHDISYSTESQKSLPIQTLSEDTLHIRNDESELFRISPVTSVKLDLLTNNNFDLSAPVTQQRPFQKYISDTNQSLVDLQNGQKLGFSDMSFVKVQSKNVSRGDLQSCNYISKYVPVSSSNSNKTEPTYSISQFDSEENVFKKPSQTRKKNKRTTEDNDFNTSKKIKMVTLSPNLEAHISTQLNNTIEYSQDSTNTSNSYVIEANSSHSGKICNADTSAEYLIINDSQEIIENNPVEILGQNYFTQPDNLIISETQQLSNSYEANLNDAQIEGSVQLLTQQLSNSSETNLNDPQIESSVQLVGFSISDNVVLINGKYINDSETNQHIKQNSSENNTNMEKEEIKAPIKLIKKINCKTVKKFGIYIYLMPVEDVKNNDYEKYLPNLKENHAEYLSCAAPLAKKSNILLIEKFKEYVSEKYKMQKAGEVDVKFPNGVEIDSDMEEEEIRELKIKYINKDIEERKICKRLDRMILEQYGNENEPKKYSYEEEMRRIEEYIERVKKFRMLKESKLIE